MKKWDIWGICSVVKHLGIIEARTEVEALRLADETFDTEEPLGLCPQCCIKIEEDSDLREIIAEEIK